MKKMALLVLVLFICTLGIMAIVGSGGSTEPANRQWSSYQSSEQQCEDWCSQRISNHNCSGGGNYHFQEGLCNCDGYNCSS